MSSSVRTEFMSRPGRHVTPAPHGLREKVTNSLELNQYYFKSRGFGLVKSKNKSILLHACSAVVIGLLFTADHFVCFPVGKKERLGFSLKRIYVYFSFILTWRLPDLKTVTLDWNQRMAGSGGVDQKRRRGPLADPPVLKKRLNSQCVLPIFKRRTWNKKNDGRWSLFRLISLASYRHPLRKLVDQL